MKVTPSDNKPHRDATACREYERGYRQALFDAAKELADSGYIRAASILTDAAMELDPHTQASKPAVLCSNCAPPNAVLVAYNKYLPCSKCGVDTLYRLGVDNP